MSDRERRVEIAKALMIMLKTKGRAPNIDVQRLFEDFREGSELVSFMLALKCI